MAATTTAVEVQTYVWRAKGFTDDVVECDRCGRAELKGTVRMVATDADGDEADEQYMGVVCAAKMTGRKAAEIRHEAKEGDAAARAARMAWASERSSFECALRDKALGRGARFPEIMAYFKTPEHL